LLRYRLDWCTEGLPDFARKIHHLFYPISKILIAIGASKVRPDDVIACELGVFLSAGFKNREEPEQVQNICEERLKQIIEVAIGA
jgi:hypothetical protein